MRKARYIPDPVHGHLELPDWFNDIKEAKVVRRMLFIRQLGLKAYIDFPGAIHTRYSHAMGCMYAAGKVTDLLEKRERELGRQELAGVLRSNREDITAAGFFHDIGHGPFSHAVDHVFKRISSKSHEDISAELLDSPEIARIENYHGVSVKNVKRIITKEHPFPFVSGIVNGPLDVDKLDYLLRDSYHVGLRYSFDLDQFIRTFRVLGDSRKREECELGLEWSNEARVTGEIFVIIWRSMYDLVYHVQDSRIAEKMLEKAVLLATEDENSELREFFTSAEKFSELNDDVLLRLLKNYERPSVFVDMITSGEVYNLLFEDELKPDTLPLSAKLLSDLADKDVNEADLADRISLLLCDNLKCPKYDVICDIIRSKKPGPIRIDKTMPDGEPAELEDLSDFIKHIMGRNVIKVYGSPSLKLDREELAKHLKVILANWETDPLNEQQRPPTTSVDIG